MATIPTHDITIAIRNSATGALLSGATVELKRAAVTETLVEISTSGVYAGTAIGAGGYDVWINSVDSGDDFVVGGGEAEAQGFDDTFMLVSTASTYELKSPADVKTNLSLENVTNVAIPTPGVPDSGKVISVDGSGNYVLTAAASTTSTFDQVGDVSTTTALGTFTLTAAQQVIFEDSSNVDILTLDEATGFVGVGPLAPTVDLQVYNSGTDAAFIVSNFFGVANGLKISDNGSNHKTIEDLADLRLILKSGAEVITINNGGDIDYDAGTGHDFKSGGTSVFELSSSAVTFGTGGTAYYLPLTRGTLDQVLKIDGSGNVTWQADTGGGLWTASGSDIYYNTGGVGIGETAPAKLLHIKAATDAASIQIENTAAAKVWRLTPARPGVANSGFSLYNVTDATTPFHVDNSGNVAIGHSNPSHLLHLEDAGSSINLNIAVNSTALDSDVRYSDGTNVWLGGILGATGFGSGVWELNNGGTQFAVSTAVTYVRDSLGIGTSTPGKSLEINSITTSECSIKLKRGSDTTGALLRTGVTAADDFHIYAGDVGTYRKFSIYASEVVINEESRDFDFRVESDVDTHSFFVEGSSGNVTFSKTTPETWQSVYTALEIGGNASLIAITAEGANNLTFWSSNAYLDAGGSWDYISTDEASQIKLGDGTIQMEVAVSGTLDTPITWIEGIRVAATEVVINDASVDLDFRVESDTITNAFFVRGSDGRVGIGTSASIDAALHVKTSAAPAITVSGDADELVLESSGASGMSIFSGVSNTGNIYFGDGAIGGQGRLVYDHSTNDMEIWAESLKIASFSKVVGGQLNIYNSGAGNAIQFQTNSGDNFFTGFSSFGFGTTGPSGLVHIFSSESSTSVNTLADDLIVESSADTGISIWSGTGSTGNIYFGNSGDNDEGIISYDHSANQLSFSVAGTSEYKMISLAFSPVTTNVNDLGSASFLWQDVWASNATIQTSDLREKKDVVELDRGLDFIDSLLPIYYRWKNKEHDRLYMGFGAQNTVDLVGSNEALVRYENDKYSMAYGELIAPMVKAIQELKQEIKELKSNG